MRQVRCSANLAGAIQITSYKQQIILLTPVLRILCTNLAHPFMQPVEVARKNAGSAGAKQLLPFC
ncbi:hypothetical protein C7N43_37920 [Sphingobacteriales bacterium UPWRP_1]|nr:hypothetical protein C7N43_37920 [Sphingobacteriales bacterium UPWRP_1]